MTPLARQLRFLLVEDNPADAELVVRQLRLARFEFEWRRVMTEADFLDGIATDPDLILSDFELPQFSGPRALELLQRSGRDIPFIVISGIIGEDAAVAVMKLGAADYLLKDRLARLGPAVLHALEAGRLHREQRALLAALKEAESRYRSIFENTIEGIYRSASDGRLLLANPAMARILGYGSPVELLQSGGDDAQLGYVDPRRRAEFKRQLAEQGLVTDFESEVRRRDGRLIWVAESAQMVRDADGLLLYYEGTVEDITDRKQAGEQVRLLTHAVREAPVSIVITDVAGSIEYVNPKFTEITGYTLAEVQGRNPRFLKSGITPPSVYTDLWATITAGRDWHGELHNLRKDGRPLWESVTIAPIPDDSGRISHFVAVKEDITERKQTEAELKLFRTLIERSNDAILVADPATGRFVDCNESSCRDLGYTRAELLTLTSADIDTTVDDQGFQAAVAGLKQSVFATREGRHRRKDGTTYPIEVSLSLVTLDRDFVVAIVRDISERQAAEKRLREQAALLDHATDAIYVRKLDGTISYWNEGAERLFGWTRAEALRRTLPELSLQQFIPATDANSVLITTGAWTGELRHTTKAGREVHILSRQTLVRDATGHPVSVFSINTDITEQKQLEARFLQAQRLENLGSLASGIAHDLNNVLAPILMATDLLKKRLPEAADQKMIATMAASAKRGADIVRQVLTFARGVKGERVPVQLRHLLREMAEIATETFPPTVQVELDVAKDLWPVLGDATQLHQVLMNLCINARDAMPQGGRLSLGGANVTLDETFATMTPGAKAGPHVCIKVTDTGTGIPAELFGKIFDPFFTTKETGKGTGLGLSTVLGIIKSHGGFLRFTSNPGLGSCFVVYLPAASGAESPPDRTAGMPIPRGKGEIILIVEDEPAIRAIASRILEHYGYRPLLAADGSEAMAVYVQQASAIAAVVTDMVMPGMDGPTLIRTLRRINPRLPLVGMTGFGERYGTDHLEDLGLPATLMKPFTAENLLTALHDVLHRTPRSPATPTPSPSPDPSAPNPRVT